MNMLPPGRPGVSSCSISCRTRASRPGLSARTSTLFERASAMIVTRCWASIGPGPGCAGSASSRFSSATTSSADAFRSGTRIGSAPRRLVERRDDPVDPPQVVRVIRDDERVAARKRGDRVVRRDQRTQDVDELRRRLVLERDHLGDQPIAAGGERSHGHRAALLLGVGLGHDLHDAVAFDDGEALQPQRREQRGVDEASRHRARRDDVDRALDPGIDQEIAAGDLGDRLDDRLDVRVDEIERDGIVGGGRERRESRPRARKQARRARTGRGGAGALRRMRCTGLRSFVVKRAPGRIGRDRARGCRARENCTNRSTRHRISQRPRRFGNNSMHRKAPPRRRKAESKRPDGRILPGNRSCSGSPHEPPCRHRPAFATSPAFPPAGARDRLFPGPRGRRSCRARRPSTPRSRRARRSPGARSRRQSRPRSRCPITDGRGAEIKIDVGESGATSVTPTRTSPDAAASTPRVRQARSARKRPESARGSTIDGLGTDKEFDSFDEFVHDEPALAAMVVGDRHRRLLRAGARDRAHPLVPDAQGADAERNDAEARRKGNRAVRRCDRCACRRQAARRRCRALLRAGEAGAAPRRVVRPAQGRADGRRRASRCRCIPCSTTAEPNVVGLVLLFVGLGFVVLWWFEQRHLVRRQLRCRDAPPGPGPAPRPGSPAARLMVATAHPNARARAIIPSDGGVAPYRCRAHCPCRRSR